MLNNTKFLHLLLGDCDWNELHSFDPHSLKKKYPGEHIALTSSENCERLKELDLFHEIVSVDLRFIQKASFSPILGDSIAFKFLFKSLHPITQTVWTKVFNYSPGTLNNSLTAILCSEQVIGTQLKGNETLCLQSPLKLKHLISDWNLADTTINSWLVRKALSQLDISPIEKVVLDVLEHKSSKSPGELKGLLAGVAIESASENVQEALQFAHETFTLVSLNPLSSNVLRSLNLSFIDWTDRDPESKLLLDMELVNFNPQESPWSRSIDVRGKGSSELSDVFADVLSKNFSKWSSLAFLFDYLGSAKLALACEKIISRYDRRFTAAYLQDEISALKVFAKVLLDSIRKQGSQSQEAMTQHFSSTPSTISFVAAIELSLHPSLAPLYRNDSDLLAIKSRMRNLNSYYERIHKACNIDLPKSDLALTL